MTAIGILLYAIGAVISALAVRLNKSNNYLDWTIALCAGMGLGLTVTGFLTWVWRVLP